jgi:hypothetical protein
MVSDTLLVTELCQQKIDGGLITQLADDILFCKSALETLGLAGLYGFPPLIPTVCSACSYGSHMRKQITRVEGEMYKWSVTLSGRFSAALKKKKSRHQSPLSCCRQRLCIATPRHRGQTISAISGATGSVTDASSMRSTGKR